MRQLVVNKREATSSPIPDVTVMEKKTRHVTGDGAGALVPDDEIHDVEDVVPMTFDHRIFESFNVYSMLSFKTNIIVYWFLLGNYKQEDTAKNAGWLFKDRICTLDIP